ncbi:MAG: hypothetical protein N3H32_02485 [Nitrososphaeria archaeon]|nr:hypothetical protein [Nitrososphaeria archaeon]MDW8044037.1 thiamine-phosphate synthase family protein [Nitrososphaerota archaeon]
MRPPEEMLVETFLPALRGLLAHRLRSKGISQSRIARSLNVTQAAVSYYLSTPQARFRERLAALGIPEEDLEALVDSLAEDVLHDAVKSTETIVTAWRSFLAKGYLCEHHRSLYPELTDCDVCLKLGSTGGAEQLSVLSSLERAVKAIESSPLLVHLAPEVSINVAESIRQPKDLDDVAAIPGRIVRVGSHLRAVSRPAFGTSRHLASVLLGAKRRGVRWSAVMNVKYDSGVLEAVRAAGLRHRFTERGQAAGEEEVVAAVVEALARGELVDVVIDEGGPGLEPTTYVFGLDALDAVRKAEAIARAYLASAAKSDKARATGSG